MRILQTPANLVLPRTTQLSITGRVSRIRCLMPWCKMLSGTIRILQLRQRILGPHGPRNVWQILTCFRPWISPAAIRRRWNLRSNCPVLDLRDREFDIAQAGFDGLWELDLFGRVRRNVEAARGDLGAAAANLRDARVSVIAEVSRNYFILRGLQDQLSLTEKNADSEASTFKLTQVRLQAGRGNQLDTARAEAQWRTTLASIPSLQTTIATTIYRLSVLTGRQPNALSEKLSPVFATPALPVLNSIGTPEMLLRRRPDVRVAERRLAAATARIGVAMGDLFPRVTLTGDIGYAAPVFSDFGHSDARFFAFGPSISWAAFDLGRVNAQIGTARAETDAALAAYQGAVLNALETTEGALIGYGRTQSRRDALQLAAAASDKAADLARKRFEGGLIDFLEVLDAERTALSAELLLSQSRTDTATALVAVYKALGAGWGT